MLNLIFNFFIKAHTNPVLIIFISLLYHQNLRNIIRNFKNKTSENKKLNNFSLELCDELMGPNTNSKYQIETEKFGERSYKKNIVNKWHLILFLIKNPILIIDRKHNLINGKKKSENSINFDCFCKKKSNHEDDQNLIVIEQ